MQKKKQYFIIFTDGEHYKSTIIKENDPIKAIEKAVKSIFDVSADYETAKSFGYQLLDIHEV